MCAGRAERPPCTERRPRRTVKTQWSPRVRVVLPAFCDPVCAFPCTGPVPPIRLGYRGFRQARAPLRRCALAHERTRRGFGLPFPDQPHMQVKSPRRTGTGWLLPVVGVGGPGTFAIDGKSLLMRSLTITTQGMRIVEHARALDRVPPWLCLSLVADCHCVAWTFSRPRTRSTERRSRQFPPATIASCPSSTNCRHPAPGFPPSRWAGPS